MVVDASSKGGSTVSAVVGVFSDFVDSRGSNYATRVVTMGTLSLLRCLRAARSRPAMRHCVGEQPSDERDKRAAPPCWTTDRP